MNHKHRQVLHQIFTHPEPANLSPADVNALLVELGATLEERAGARYAATLNGHTVVFHHAQHSVDKTEVRQIRKFLESADVDPVRDFPV